MDEAAKVASTQWTVRGNPEVTATGTNRITVDPFSKVTYTVLIQPHSYGYMVQVGCATFAIETKEKLIEKLTEYLADPKGTELKYLEGKLF